MTLATVISSRQIKAARALLDWSQENLAEAAALSVATIRKLEVGHISPRPATTGTIRRAIEEAGLEFIESEGVRRRNDDIVIYQGPDRVAAFHDDVCGTVRRSGGEVLIVMAGTKDMAAVDEGLLPALLETHPLTAIKCLATAGGAQLPPFPRCERRTISKQLFDPVPFYVYGNKYAMMVPGADPAPKIVVMHSAPTARAARSQFYSMWEKTG